MDHPSGRKFLLVEGIHVDTNIGLKGIEFGPLDQTDDHATVRDTLPCSSVEQFLF